MVEVIKSNGWGELVNAGRFEEVKAMLSLEATKHEFLTKQTHRTIIEVFQKPTATLATVKKYRGEAKLQAVVEHLLKSTVKFLNVGRGMNEWQIAETARMIVADYYYLTVADLKVCFRNGISGKYGQVYDRIDGMIVLEWVANYDTERAQVAEMESTKKAKAVAETQKAVHMPEWLSEKLRQMEERHKKAFSLNASNAKFSNLESFLVSIDANDVQSKTTILETWESVFVSKCPEMSFDDWMVYCSNLALVSVNNGSVREFDGLLKIIQ